MCRYFDNGTLRAIRIGLYLQQEEFCQFGLPTCRILTWKLSGISLPRHMVKVHVTVWVVQSNMKQQEPVCKGP